MSDPLSSYEKQMKWRQANLKKADKIKSEKQIQEESTKFEPTFYTQQSMVKNFDGSARELNEKSSQKFVERYQRARKEKEIISSKLAIKPTSVNVDEKAKSVSGESSLPSYYMSEDQNFQYPHREFHPSEDQINAEYPQEDYDEISSPSESDEPIIELLERERRQWQAEREKLIQCIHLQQLELTQRALASQERALEIAKDFSRLIETFEERLVKVETSVQGEISSLRSVADLLLAATKQQTPVVSQQISSPTPSTAVSPMASKIE